MLKRTRVILLAFVMSSVMLIAIRTQSVASTKKNLSFDEINNIYLPTLYLNDLSSPLFEGFSARWDGTGYLHWDVNYVTGSHFLRDILTADGDIGEVSTVLWYDPDPLEYGSSFWIEYYSLAAGKFLSSSSTKSPYWKWEEPWIIPYDIQFSNGQNVLLDEQNFLVTGPHSGYATFGKPVQYWELTNSDLYLFWDDGGDWKQYVLPGDAILRYDADQTRLLIHYDVKRTDFYKGEKSQYTVHYIENLSRSNSWPGLAQTEVFVSMEGPNNYDNRAPSYVGQERGGLPFRLDYRYGTPDD